MQLAVMMPLQRRIFLFQTKNVGRPLPSHLKVISQAGLHQACTSTKFKELGAQTR
jgi:hypothetical protein